MDDYPDHLAPEFEDSGAVKTPFREWWERVKTAFPTVPENVAQYWLHEHWGRSPYSYLPSRAYQFDRVTWPAEKLWDIRSNWCGFDPLNAACVAQGEYQVALTRKPFVNRTAEYIREHGDFPVPIVVLDNRDCHLRAENVDKPYKAVPEGYVLIEGHRRFNLALYFQKSGLLDAGVTIWLMSRR